MIPIKSDDLDTIKGDFEYTVVGLIEDLKKSLTSSLEHFSKHKVIKRELFDSNPGLYTKMKIASRAILNNPNIKAKDIAEFARVAEKIRKKDRAKIAQRKSSLATLFEKLDNGKLIEIITSSPAQLKKLNDELIDHTFSKDDIIWKYLFNYDNDLSKAAIEKVVEALNIKVCPYCNRNFIGKVISNDGSKVIGPSMDHFFSQKEHPILALSFFNLIPSCTPCNSNLKGSKEFKLDDHMHPYLQSRNDLFSFDINLTIKPDGTHSVVSLKPTIKLKEGITDKNKRRLIGAASVENSGSLNVFKTIEIYNTHEDLIEEIHSKFEKNNGTYLASVQNLLDELKSSEKEFYRFHFANYFEEQDFNQRPLAKLSRDIYDQMKDLYPLRLRF